MQIVRILGNNYSGSTLLAAMLNKHPQIFAGSEIYHINQFLPGSKVETPNVICSCTLESGKICDFWTEIVEKAGDSTQIYRILAEKTGKEIIVDSTKFSQKGDDSTEFGGFYDGLDEYSTLFIHMYKPIEEYAASCIRYGLADPDYIANSWCARNNTKGFQINYCEFVKNPEKYLLRIFDILKIEYRVLTDFWCTDKHHLLAGNDGVLAFYHPKDFNGKSTDALNMRPDHRKNFRTIFYDPDRWKQEVTQEIQDKLWSIPNVRWISEKLGLGKL